jgi:hypothetical protein
MEFPLGTEFFDVDGVPVARLQDGRCVRGNGDQYENHAKVFAEGMPLSRAEFAAFRWADSDEQTARHSTTHPLAEAPSAMDEAIDYQKRLLEDPDFGALTIRGGRTKNWISCLSIYSALAVAQGMTTVHPSVWNTIRRAISVRMASCGISGVGKGNPKYYTLESDAYREFGHLDQVARELLHKRTWYAPKPIADILARHFIRDANVADGLSIATAHNIEKARATILPELQRVFS